MEGLEGKNMNVSKSISDILWDISTKAEVDNDRNARRFIVALSKNKANFENNIVYVKRRLIKGLRASDELIRQSFVNLLIEVLKSFRDNFSTGELIEISKKLIYDVTTESKSEELCLHHAKLLLLDVLLQSGRLVECATTSVFRKNLPSIVSSCKSINSNSIGDHLCFFLRHKKAVPSVPIINSELFDLKDKKVQKKLATGVLNSKLDKVAFSLLDFAFDESVFDSIWRRLQSVVLAPGVSVKTLSRFIACIEHLCCLPDPCDVSSSSTKLQQCLTKSVLGLLHKQLTSSRIACHSVTASAVKRILLHHTKQTASNPAQSSIDLLTLVIDRMPLFDLNCVDKENRICRVLLTKLSRLAEPKLLLTYTSQLITAFNSPAQFAADYWLVSQQKDDQGESASHESAIRRFVPSQLSYLMTAVCLSSSAGRDDKSSNRQKLTNAILQFLATNCSTPSSSSKQLSCWSDLFRCLAVLANHCLPSSSARQHRRRQKPIDDDVSLWFNCLTLTLRQLAAATNHDSALTSRSNRAFKLIESTTTDSDWLSRLVVSLYAVTLIYALSQPDASVRSALLDVLDDLKACLKHRAKSSLDRQPHWSAVLTDSLLSLLAQPCNLLRSLVSSTFLQLVTSSNIDPRSLPVKLIADVVTSRVANTTDEDGDEVVDFSDDRDQSDGVDQDSDDDDDKERKHQSDNSHDDDSKSGEAGDLTDEQMFALDAELAEAVRLGRSTSAGESRIKRSQKAASLVQLKSRCLDFLVIIVEHSSQPDLVFDTLRLAVELAKQATGKSALKGKSQSTDSLPLHSVSAIFTTLERRDGGDSDSIVASLLELSADTRRRLFIGLFTDSILPFLNSQDKLSSGIVVQLASLVKYLFRLVVGAKWTQLEHEMADQLLACFVKRSSVEDGSVDDSKCLTITISKVYRPLLTAAIFSSSYFATSIGDLLKSIFSALSSTDSSSQPLVELLSLTSSMLLASNSSHHGDEAKSILKQFATIVIEQATAGLCNSEGTIIDLVNQWSVRLVEALFDAFIAGVKSCRSCQSTADQIIPSALVDRLRHLPSSTLVNNKRKRQTLTRLTNFIIEEGRKAGGINGQEANIGDDREQRKAAKLERKRQRRANRKTKLEAKHAKDKVAGEKQQQKTSGGKRRRSTDRQDESTKPVNGDAAKVTTTSKAKRRKVVTS